MALARVLFILLGLGYIAFGMWSLRRRSAAANQEHTRAAGKIGSLVLILTGLGVLIGVITGEVDKELTDLRQIEQGYAAALISLVHPHVAVAAALRLKEAIVNLLDLISFLLITPELVEKYSESRRFSRIVGLVSSAVAVMAASAGLWLFLSAMIYASGASTRSRPYVMSRATAINHSFGIALILVAALCIPLLIYLRSRPGSALSLAVARRRLLWCGVLLFFLSRLFAVTAGLRSEASSGAEPTSLTRSGADPERSVSNPGADRNRPER